MEGKINIAELSNRMVIVYIEKRLYEKSNFTLYSYTGYVQLCCSMEDAIKNKDIIKAAYPFIDTNTLSSKEPIREVTI